MWAYGHQIKECNLSGEDIDKNELKNPYGEWLRAEDGKANLPLVEKRSSKSTPNQKSKESHHKEYK